MSDDQLQGLQPIVYNEYEFRAADGKRVTLHAVVVCEESAVRLRSLKRRYEEVESRLAQAKKSYAKQRNVAETGAFAMAYLAVSISIGGPANPFAFLLVYGLGRWFARRLLKLRLALPSMLRELRQMESEERYLEDAIFKEEERKSDLESLPEALRGYLSELACAVIKHNAIIEHFNSGLNLLLVKIRAKRIRIGKKLAARMKKMRQRLEREQCQIMDALAVAEVAALGLAEQAIRGQVAGAVNLEELRIKVEVINRQLDEERKMYDEVRRELSAPPAARGNSEPGDEET